MGGRGAGDGSQRIIWGISGQGIICSDEKCAACSGNLAKLYLAQKLQQCIQCCLHTPVHTSVGFLGGILTAGQVHNAHTTAELAEVKSVQER